jgi:hypothetical protein
VLAGALLRDHRQIEQAVREPLHECLVPVRLFEAGIGHVIVSRRLSHGNLAVAGFLVDVYCVGVKNAFLRVFPADVYEERFHHSSVEPMQPEEPACARKLVEDAAAYARDLGFAPHPDYRFARMIWGSIDATACEAEYTFGSEGKPLYVSGPYDTIERSKEIVSTLLERCGPDGFHYVVAVEDPSQLGIDPEAFEVESETEEVEEIAGELIAGDESAAEKRTTQIRVLRQRLPWGKES